MMECCENIKHAVDSAMVQAHPSSKFSIQIVARYFVRAWYPLLSTDGKSIRQSQIVRLHSKRLVQRSGLLAVCMMRISPEFRTSADVPQLLQPGGASELMRLSPAPKPGRRLGSC